MKTKGFSLIELLTVIVLLGVISLVIVPSVGNIIKKSKEDALIEVKSELIKAVKKMAADNPNILPNDSSEYKCLTMDEIKRSNYIHGDKITNPTTNEDMTGYIKITFSDKYNQYKYNYEDICE